MSNQRPMYKAELQPSGDLVVTEVTFEIYRRIGTEGLCHSKVGAIGKLKRRIMDKFIEDMRKIDWQSLEYVRLYRE